MRKIMPLILAISGLALIIYSVLSGRSYFALVLIFPVVYGTDPLLLLGVLMLMAGSFLFFYTPMPISEIPPQEFGSTAEPSVEDEPREFPDEERVKKRYGMVIMIGPIPIVLGSDKNMVLASLVATAIIILALILILL